MTYNRTLSCETQVLVLKCCKHSSVMIEHSSIEFVFQHQNNTCNTTLEVIEKVLSTLEFYVSTLECRDWFSKPGQHLKQKTWGVKWKCWTTLEFCCSTLECRVAFQISELHLKFNTWGYSEGVVNTRVLVTNTRVSRSIFNIGTTLEAETWSVEWKCCQHSSSDM